MVVSGGFNMTYLKLRALETDPEVSCSNPTEIIRIVVLSCCVL
jgi:hypothetical protein